MSEEESSGELKIISEGEFARLDGKEGRSLYIVFKGKVYDLSKSSLWIKGKHMGMHNRNEDLSESIKNAPHGEEMLERFPVAGTLSKTAPQKLDEISNRTEPSVKEEQPLQSSGIDRRTFLKAALGVVSLAYLPKIPVFSDRYVGFNPQLCYGDYVVLTDAPNKEIVVEVIAVLEEQISCTIPEQHRNKIMWKCVTPNYDYNDPCAQRWIYGWNGRSGERTGNSP